LRTTRPRSCKAVRLFPGQGWKGVESVREPHGPEGNRRGGLPRVDNTLRRLDER